MNPATGTFTTMDTYAGSIFDPTSLHKYLYANANPVTYSDPTGNFADAKSFIAGFNVSTILEAGAAIAGACVMAIGRNVISKLRVGAAFSLVSHTVANVLEDIHYIELIQQGYVNLAALYMMDQVSGVIKAVQDAVDKLNEQRQSYYVYLLVDNEGTVRYVGRTKNLDQRLKSHSSVGSRNKNLMLGYYVSNLNYEQSRALEQSWMVFYHTRNWLSEEGNNLINGVSPKNKRKTDYLGALDDIIENVIDDELLSIKEELTSWW